MEKQFSLLIALDIKRKFNKAESSYILLQLFAFLFYFLAVTRRDFLYYCKRRIFDGLFKPSGAKNCDNMLPLSPFIVFASDSSYEVITTNVDIISKVSRHETWIPTRLVHTHKNRQGKLESVSLSQLHFKLPSKVQRHDVPLRIRFKMAAVDVRFRASLETNYLG